mmetsp:Transcript_96793/g.270182  ORF Transcript_96793/g.270182 Transcript_96793/m.270182 type:complete len:467 (+) Transcript_96793:2484-3884(+)
MVGRRSLAHVRDAGLPTGPEQPEGGVPPEPGRSGALLDAFLGSLRRATQFRGAVHAVQAGCPGQKQFEQLCMGAREDGQFHLHRIPGPVHRPRRYGRHPVPVLHPSQRSEEPGALPERDLWQRGARAVRCDGAGGAGGLGASFRDVEHLGHGEGLRVQRELQQHGSPGAPPDLLPLPLLPVPARRVLVGRTPERQAADARIRACCRAGRPCGAGGLRGGDLADVSGRHLLLLALEVARAEPARRRVCGHPRDADGDRLHAHAPRAVPRLARGPGVCADPAARRHRHGLRGGHLPPARAGRAVRGLRAAGPRGPEPRGAGRQPAPPGVAPRLHGARGVRPPAAPDERLRRPDDEQVHQLRPGGHAMRDLGLWQGAAEVVLGGAREGVGLLGVVAGVSEEQHQGHCGLHAQRPQHAPHERARSLRHEGRPRVGQPRPLRHRGRPRVGHPRPLRHEGCPRCLSPNSLHA